MREHRPEYVERNCTGCNKLFQAHRRSIGYSEYCKDCLKKKGWLPSKGKQGKVSNFNKYT